MKFLKYHGRSLLTVNVIKHLKDKIAEAEGDFDLYKHCRKRASFTKKDIELISLVCKDNFPYDDGLNPKGSLDCYRCITSTINPEACEACSIVSTFNEGVSFIKTGDYTFSDIKELRKYVEKENSMYFI